MPSSSRHPSHAGLRPESAAALVFAAGAALEFAAYLLPTPPVRSALPAAGIVYFAWAALFAVLSWKHRAFRFLTTLFLAALWSGLSAAGLREGPIAFQGAGVVVAFLWLGLYSRSRTILYAAPLTFAILLLSSLDDMGLATAALASLAFTGAGGVAGVVASITTTELRSQRERLASAQQLAQIGSWEWDLKSGQGSWSAELHEIFGTDPEAWTPTLEPFLQRVHEDDRDRVREAIQRTATEGVPYEITYRATSPDGRTRTIRARGEMVRDSVGKPERVHGTAQDITEVHRAQELAKQAELDRVAREEAERTKRQVEAVLESMTDAYYLLGPDWCILHVNSQATKVLGTEAADLIGAEVWKSFPEAEPRIRPRYERVLSTETPEEFEFHFIEWDRWFNVRAFPTPAGLSVFSRDITEEKDLREALAQAQKMEAIGTLTGGLAHDFNNLLTVVSTNATLLESSIPEADPDARECLQDIRRSTREGTEMIRRLLAFSRKGSVKLEPTRMDEFVMDVHQSLLRLMPSSIEIRCDVAADLPRALIDRTSLTQVLLNLALNARDAMPEGGELYCAVTETEVSDGKAELLPGLEAARYVQVEVVDTGVGMSEDIRARIFEPFFTTKPADKGTGLGLAVVYGIVQQHGGAIEVESAPGEGTHFRVLLPLAGAADDGDAAGSEAAGPSAAGRERSRDLTILVADDDDRLRSATRRVLHRFGHRVLTARDGQEALEVFKEEKDTIDLVVTDLSMPRVTGVELIEEIRRIDSSAPVLIVTGWGSLERGEKKPDRSVPLLRKPWTVQKFLDAIQAAAR